MSSRSACAVPAHRREYGDVPGWAVPTGDPRTTISEIGDTMSIHIPNQASPQTLAAREVEQAVYKAMIAVEERDPDGCSDLWCALRLAWMEAGRDLERRCEADGIGRWSYRWAA